MRVIYIPQYFQTPEEGGAIRSYHLAKGMVDAGIEVEMITAHDRDYYDFRKIDVRVGTVVSAEPFPEARKPSIRMVIDFGPDIGMRKSSAQLVKHYKPTDLIGRQVAAVMNFPPRQIGPTMSEVLTLGFPDEEGGIWTFDERTEEWYLHHFYSHQPDLNVANPKVRDEIMKVIGFWLELGIDGFRVDAVPFFLEDVGMTGEDADAMAEPHEHLKNIRAFLSRRRGDAIMLGEVNVPHEEQVKYFGDGHQLHMMFDFIAMQKLYLSLARADAGPLTEALLDRLAPALATSERR